MAGSSEQVNEPTAFIEGEELAQRLVFAPEALVFIASKLNSINIRVSAISHADNS
jgi:hypothetical protein